MHQIFRNGIAFVVAAAVTEKCLVCCVCGLSDFIVMGIKGGAKAISAWCNAISTKTSLFFKMFFFSLSPLFLHTVFFLFNQSVSQYALFWDFTIRIFVLFVFFGCFLFLTGTNVLLLLLGFDYFTFFVIVNVQYLLFDIKCEKQVK